MMQATRPRIMLSPLQLVCSNKHNSLGVKKRPNSGKKSVLGSVKLGRFSRSCLEGLIKTFFCHRGHVPETNFAILIQEF